MTAAIPTYSLSAAATPAFRWRWRRVASVSPRWWSTAWRAIGDNWRLRYRGLKLHNKTPVNHLRYLPFPSTFPEYIPKDKIANWLESYVDIMEVDFWTRTAFDGAEYDEAAQRWTARLTREGAARTLRPKHIVLATSVSGTPNIPDIEGIGNFKGEVLHSSRFKAGREWTGRPVIVFGTGTSAHDICQELQAAGADVTMVQRSPTMVVNVEPAQLYDRTYLGDGPPIASRDILNSGVPLPVMKLAHKLVTDEVKRLDAPLLRGWRRPVSGSNMARTAPAGR